MPGSAANMGKRQGSLVINLKKQVLSQQTEFDEGLQPEMLQREIVDQGVKCFVACPVLDHEQGAMLDVGSAKG